VLWRQAGGVLVLAEARDRAQPPVAQRGPALVVWLALDEPASVDELADVLGDVLDVPAASLGVEITAVLESLGSQGFVETVP
jgi:hypothetical protein